MELNITQKIEEALIPLFNKISKNSGLTKVIVFSISSVGFLILKRYSEAKINYSLSSHSNNFQNK